MGRGELSVFTVLKGNISLMKITHGTQGLAIEYDRNNPPVIFFDTNVWRGMSHKEIKILQRLHQQHGFRYHYSVINFAELASHLEDKPSDKYPDPFQRFKSCFVRMRALCEREILPSPEMEFLIRAELSHYIDPVWIPDREQAALAVELITNANNLAELTGEEDKEPLAKSEPRYVVKPSHYRILRDVDGDSIRTVMEQLRQFKRPAMVDDKLMRWFLRLAEFFLLIRSSCGKINYDSMTHKEQDRFMWGLTHGAGVIF